MDMYQKRKIRAEKKNNNQEEKLTKVGINWYPGHMAKTKREIKEKIEVNKELNDKRKEKGLKERKVRILILGIPNVGKSTLINTLVGKKATNVGNKPGITRHLEWIRINKDIELLDTPGILWPKLDDDTIAHNLAAMTAIKEEILDTEDIAIYIINTMLKLYKDSIVNRYNLTSYNDVVEVLDMIGKKIGAVRNNETDYEKVYSTILRDLREGYLGKVTFDRL